MKSSSMNSIHLAVGLLATACAPLFAQTTATTDPVGFITLTVAGHGGSGVDQLSFQSMGLTRAVEYQGSAETAGGVTIVDNEATWTDNQFNGAAGSYFLEITSGPGAGTTYGISQTTAATKTITLAQSLAAGVTAPVSFKVRKQWTLAALFGPANESGLGGGSSTSADQILVSDGLGGYDIYYYQTSGIGGVGWRKSGAPAVDASGTGFFLDDALIVKRKQSANVSVVVMGAVKTGQTSVPIVDGNNFVGNVYAAPMTLQSCGIYTGNSATGLAGGSSTSADQVLVWNGTGYDVYYYQTSGIGGVGWRKAGAPSTDASGTSLPVGQSLIINRKLTGSPFNWVIPQHPATI